MNECNTIGARIKDLREYTKLTQAQLAKELFTTRENVNYWENNQRDIKTQTIIQIANYFNVSCDYLLTGVSSKNLDIHKSLGLNEISIKNLVDVRKNFKNICDLFMENDEFLFFMKNIYNYVTKSREHKINSLEDIDISNALDAGFKSLCHSALDNLLASINKGDIK